MEQINNIQIGNQTYQIGGTGSGNGAGGGSAVTRGEEFVNVTLSGRDVLAGAIRPNKVYNIYPKNGEVGAAVIGVPLEVAQESGELWTMALDMPIIVSHDSTDIPGCPHKATLFGSYSIDELNESFEGLALLLNTNATGQKTCLYCSSKFLEMTESDTVIVRLCLLDGTVVHEEAIPSDVMTNFILMMTVYSLLFFTGDTMLVGIFLNMPIAISGNVEENSSAEHRYSMSFNLGSDSLTIEADSFDTGSPVWVDGNLVGICLYTGPSEMTVNPLSHYMLNINLSENAGYITNIPVAWADDTPPTFAANKMVQMSILDGVGSFNTVTVNFDEDRLLW